ncbi:TIR domain-containing protein [Dehalococcoides mccartyi]|jgi:hypothetical protein
MPRLKSYGVFISHAWDHSSDYDRLEKMLKEKAKRFECRNCSVPKYDPLHAKNKRQLVKALRDQIRPANVVLIICGMYVKHREWIQKEIDIAKEMGKPIIGIAPRGAERIPQEIQAIAPIIPWGTKKIVDAIRHANTLKPEQPESKQNTTDSSSNQWNRDLTSSPDFKALRRWINDPDNLYSPGSEKKKIMNLERRRGMSG